MSDTDHQEVFRLFRADFEAVRDRTKKKSPTAGMTRQEREARDRDRNAENQRRRRARLKAAGEKEVDDLLGSLDMPTQARPYTAVIARAEAAALKTWLALDGPRQRQLRGRARDIMARRMIIAVWRQECAGQDPTPTEFGRGLGISRAKAQTILDLNRNLEAAGVWGEAHTGTSPGDDHET